MKRRALLLTALAAPAGVEAGRRIVYPQPDAGRSAVWTYLQQVLQLAIERGGGGYELVESREFMTQARVVRELADATGRLDLGWTMTSIEREAQLLPVRVPLDRGLIGWRIAFVRAADAQRWSGLRSLDELRRHVAVQGHDWPDTEILRANGLPVREGNRFEALLEMVRLGRADYFPRALFEIDDEAASELAHGLVIEPHVLLRYPAASYLFVRPDQPTLAADLQRGLDAAATDGSLKRLFDKRFGDLLQRHQVARRVQLRLNNPLLPPATPLDKPAYWLVTGG
ncbi:substrate-binding periplasmic protein [Roseateles sp. LKC17W]|uniref:Substrate-binding periplasmic protein n=1 Tax=Pelomonas margarita TaxID=3299031 RepID=A0ABW7FKZ4_9BURK